MTKLITLLKKSFIQIVHSRNTYVYWYYSEQSGYCFASTEGFLTTVFLQWKSRETECYDYRIITVSAVTAAACALLTVDSDDSKYVQVTGSGNYTRNCAAGTIFDQGRCACVLGASKLKGT